MVKDKRFSIIGFGRSGQAIAKLITAKGGIAFISENKPLSKEQLKTIADYNLRYETSHSEKIWDTDYIVISPGIPDTIPVLLLENAKKIPILSEIEIASRLMKNKFIGITGTNGKSTTAFLTYQLLKSAKAECDLGGNISPGRSLSEIAIEEPDKDKIVVVELSSFQLEHIHKFSPSIGIITNISEDHLDRYKTMQKYIDAKMNLLKSVKSEGYRIINADDKYLMKEEATSNTLFVSSKEVESGAFLKEDEIIIRLNGKEKSFDLHSFELKGIHNRYNLMFALLATLAVKNIDSISADMFGSLKGLEHRMEFVAEINKTAFYNNSMCTNPEAFLASLRTFDKNQIVIVGGRNKNFDINIIIDAIIKYAKHAVLIGEVKDILKRRLTDKGYSSVSVSDTLESALKSAIDNSKSGDVINFSPGFASFDMFKDFADRGNKFKEAVRRI